MRPQTFPRCLDRPENGGHVRHAKRPHFAGCEISFLICITPCLCAGTRDPTTHWIKLPHNLAHFLMDGGTFRNNDTLQKGTSSSVYYKRKAECACLAKE